jgi:hypothetical protein
MKKYLLLAVVIVLVLSIAGFAKNTPVWASSQSLAGADSGGVNAPLQVVKTITESGVSNIGGVCTIDVEFKVPGVKLIADAEVPVLESKKVPFYPETIPGYEEQHLLFPGCHFVHYKLDETNEFKVVDQLSTDDGSAKVCFGASPTVLATIYYYLDNPAGGNKVWLPIPATLEDKGRLVCAPALYTGVYMPAASIPIIPVSGIGGAEGVNGNIAGGSVLPPSSKVIITGSGTYAVGGICTIEAQYKVSGLSDTVEVEWALEQLSEDTLVVPTDAVDGIFYFPGCHVLHYKDQKIKDQMTREEGDWKICFAAIPEKTMTVYYYQDDLTNIVPPWVPLDTTTENGVACADLVDWSAVYTPVGK